jgi:hypothetical protein
MYRFCSSKVISLLSALSASMLSMLGSSPLRWRNRCAVALGLILADLEPL